MSREEIEKLLGGYATGTLSKGERRALFEAALDDQELFDALAKEQALRDVLQDPSARRELLEALGPAREPFGLRIWRRLRQPAALAAAGAFATLLIVAGLLLRRTTPSAPAKVLVAEAPQTPANADTAPAKIFEPPPARKAKKPARLPAPPLISQPADVAKMAPAPQPRVVASTGIPSPEAQQIAPREASPPPAMASTVAAYLRAKPQQLKLSASPQKTRNLGVRYSLVSRGPDGEYVPARLDAVFGLGDAVRLRVEPSDSGYAYLFQRDANGGLRLVSTERVDKGRARDIPANSALRFDEPGAKQLLLVFSRRQQPELAALATTELDAMAFRERSHILQTSASSEDSAYVEDARIEPTEQKVAVEINLEVR
jgi:hypothetical protein